MFRSLVITVLTIGFSLAAGISPSCAADARSPSPVRTTVPMITAAAPPAGFLAMCQRMPQECRGADDVDDARIQREAKTLYWREAFGDARTSRPAADQRPVAREADVPTGSNLVPQAISLELDGLATDVTPDYEIGLATWPSQDADSGAFQASAPGTAGGDAPALSMTPEVWALVSGVNQQVNRSIRALSDPAHYGQVDYWALQSGPNQSGDCEDYALTKRHRLIEAGVPSRALSFAIVRTSWGELHAVLLLTTDQGDLVLDNLTPWIVRWDKTSYRWIERQMPGRPLEWRSVG